MITIIQKIFLISLPFFSLFQDPDSTLISKDTMQVYKVIEIKKSTKRINGTNKADLIIVQDTLSKCYYTVVSLRTKCNTSIKIKKGKFYSFHLKKYFEFDSIELGTKLSIHIDGFVIHIPMSRYTPNIYTTTNLKGIYNYP